MTRVSRFLVLIIGAQLIDAAPGPSSLHARQTSELPSTFKIAFLNIQAGRGEPGFPGRTCVFQDTTNCSDLTQPLNAWGHGVIQDELIRVVQNDPEVIAIGLAEAWETLCGSGRQVQALLGWAARTGTRNGTTMVSRYGFAGPEQWLQLDTSLNNNPADTAWVLRVPVCLDAGCSRSVDVFAAHWYGTGEFSIQTYERQAQQTVQFMAGVPPENPVVLIGDLNVWEEGGVICNQPPKPTAMQILRDGGYTDTWPTVHGSAEGYTGMWNKTGCGTPEGYLFKRIDQAWSRVAVPIDMVRFGMVTPGECAPSDHAGIVARFSLTPALDETPPSVQVTAPADGAVLSGSTVVSIAATDDTAVSRVGMSIDGIAGGEDSSAPYQLTWDTTAAANGSHRIDAWAEDQSGNRGVSAPVVVTVQNASAFDFALSASPASKRVRAGTNATYSVTTEVTAGAPALVQLSVAGLPPASTASFSPATVTGSTSAKLTVMTTSATPAGTFPLTITGSGGGMDRTATVNLVVRSR